MTLQARLVAGGDGSDRPHVEFSRLLCDDGHSASCRGGTEKTQDSRGVEGRTATGLDAASCIRQEDRGGVQRASNRLACHETLMKAFG